MLTESTTLDEYTYDSANNRLTIIWRDHIFRDGVEVAAMRVARSASYGADDIDKLAADVGPGFERFAAMLGNASAVS